MKLSNNDSLLYLGEEDKNEIASILEEELHCEVVQIIGGVIILFRKNLKDGKIHLPR